MFTHCQTLTNFLKKKNNEIVDIYIYKLWVIKKLKNK